MKNVHIRTCFPQDVTILSNEFLDRFMPQANGEFVKIYLYLLRASSLTDFRFHLGTIADALNCTDMDVLRALRYWEKTGVLRVRADADNEITEIIFVNFCNPAAWEGDAFATPREVSASAAQTVASAETGASASEEDSAATPQKIQITADERDRLSTQEEVSQMIFIAEQYLGRTLSKKDSDLLLYLYSKCGFSADLIDYLIDYCVSNGHKAYGYIREVAFAWHAAGVRTIDEAKAHSADYQKRYHSVFRALGIRSHSVTEAEKAFIDRWFDEYALPEELIKAACERTILSTGKPSLQYTESILHRWHTQGARSLADVEALDRTHAAKADKGRKPSKSGGHAGGFDFQAQRTYDFDELEMQLLNKGKKE